VNDIEIDALVARLREAEGRFREEDYINAARLVDESADAIHILKTRIYKLEAENAALRHERDMYRADRDSHQRGAIDAGLQINALREDSRMWMDRYSSLFLRVSCGVAPDTTERGIYLPWIYLSWQKEVDLAYGKDKKPWCGLCQAYHDESDPHLLERR
jgi:FtsZ-binding cell division protein ZapB